MVLIPSDAGVRMRTQTEPVLHPVLPVADVSIDLSDLPPGKVFSAQIQEVLPENTYKALVAGRQLTLALPQGAKAGDLLELVVIDRSPRVVVAQLANPTAEGASGQPYQFTSLSKAGQLIGSLLARDGQNPPSVALTRGQALLAQTPANARQLAADLAPQLARAVGESGLFYEAHQVLWTRGQLPLSALLAEPQGRYASPATLTGAALNNADADTDPAASLQPKLADLGGSGGRPGSPSAQSASSGPLAFLQTLFGLESNPAPSPPAPQTAAATPLPEELRPIVQQQLDAAATQRLAWHGDVWPQQPMHWQIQRDDGSSQQRDAEADRGWTSSLKLTTPRLGEIDAQLKLTAAGVRIAIETSHDASADNLRNAIPWLENSLAAAGVPLLSLRVKPKDSPAAEPPDTAQTPGSSEE